MFSIFFSTFFIFVQKRFSPDIIPFAEECAGNGAQIQHDSIDIQTIITNIMIQHTKSEYQAPTVIHQLINRGANIFTPINGELPIIMAAKSGKNLVVGKFLEYGCSVDQTDRDGNSILQLALMNGHYHAALFHINHEADLTHSNNGGETILHSLLTSETSPEAKSRLIDEMVSRGQCDITSLHENPLYVESIHEYLEFKKRMEQPKVNLVQRARIATTKPKIDVNDKEKCAACSIM